MELTPAVAAFWQAYLAANPDAAQGHPWPDLVDGYGSSPEMADALGRLVQYGVKTVTSGLLWEYEASGDPLPVVGDVEVTIDGQGEPLCVTEITEVAIRPFNAIDEAFAYDYGEGDRSLAWWQRALGGYYAHECTLLGRQPEETMPLVCVRFRLLFAPE